MLKQISYGNVLGLKASRTILGRPLYFTYFYLVDGLLIDTGPPHTSGEIYSALRELPANKAVISHRHEDHSGNCRMITEQLGIPVYAGEKTLQALSNPPPIKMYRQVMWGNQPPAGGNLLGSAICTDQYCFRVISTPGHSEDHVSFYEPEEGWLFSGDLYLGENLTAFMEGENIVDHLRSLELVISLKPKTLFCGLKGKLDDATGRLTRKYNHWLEIARRATEMHRSKATRKEILTAVFGGEALFYYLSGKNWGRKHMLDSIIENGDYFGHQRADAR